MRRSKQPPRRIYPLQHTSPSLDTENADDNSHRLQLPPIKDTFLVSPPPGRPERPQFGRRACRPVNGTLDSLGLHPSKSQSQATAAAAGRLTSQSPSPWGTEEPYRVQKSSSNVSAKVHLPEIIHNRCQLTRGHLRVRPANTDLLILNEVEYSYEPATIPCKISPEFPSINGQRLRIKSPRVRTQVRRASSHHVDVGSENIPGGDQSKATRSGSTHLPHLDMLLKKRGISRSNFYN
ncbi:uncharacterized protein [Haliotis asinina]|uniref:uncharacterized protein n=1 Tax=Haliotis asinina TaxID=109174 RepID=UPI0035325B1D